MNSKYLLYSPETPQLVTDLSNYTQSFTSLQYLSYLSSRGFYMEIIFLPYKIPVVNMAPIHARKHIKCTSIFLDSTNNSHFI